MAQAPRPSDPSTALCEAPAGLVVAVRALCECTARSGDLDLRFSPSPTGAEGVAGHGEVAARRAPGYQREVRLTARYRPADAGPEETLDVQGRADGFDPGVPRLEEIKTHRGEAAHIPANQQALHRAQAQVYGHLLCQQLGLPRIEVAVVYFNIDTGLETPLAQWHSADELQRVFEDLCGRYWAWAQRERAHRLARDAALRGLRWPFDDFRPGQRTLAEGVYRSQRAGRHLLAQAPTGIGKTVATLFAALRAAPDAGTDKLFYLTAKTPGRQLALDALARLRQATAGTATALPLRVLERVAREKACEHPDKACHGDACPLARGFYDRLPQARADATQAGWLDKAALRETALHHQICPYFLGQDLLRWSDVVVGDFNHFFDLNAHAHALTTSEGWRVGLLVDEAHNLVERARQMHSATLEPAAFQAVRASAAPGLKRALGALHRRWNALDQAQTAPYEVLPGLPEPFMATLRTVCERIAEHLAQPGGHSGPGDANGTDGDGGSLLRWYFEALHFLRVADGYGEHTVFDLSRPASIGAAPRKRVHHPVLCLRNLVPAPLLQPRWAAAHSATLFSATLSPMDHAQDLLGLPDNTARLDVPSPFDPAQLRVYVTPHISTRFSDRAASLHTLVDTLAAQFAAQAGNYLAFFSSFDYLQQAMQGLQTRHPGIPVWAQSRQMREPEREAFIARFTPEGQGIGFAVLGGAFGEGIDLPGQRLIGAFIATLGLPQVNPVNELLRQRLQARFGRGYDDAYRTPGLHKVVQAAGRVIRTGQDQGTLFLMDDRFAHAEVRRVLPAWWKIQMLHARDLSILLGAPPPPAEEDQR